MPRRFTPVPWFSHASLYEVNIRQYTPEGTFAAFAQHLPRLAEMGVQVLWLMPITPISREGRQGTLGSYYACSDYKAVNPEFGSLDDFRDLVLRAHHLGMKIIIDWVANHTGLDHVWTKTNPGFYKKDADGKFYDSNGWIDVIDLNYYDQPMRRAMIDAMAYWVQEAGIDGFRCDMAHLVPLDFWQQARTALDPLKQLFWLAETEDLHYLDVFDSCYAWRWMHLTEKFCRGETDTKSLVELLTAYEKEFPYTTCPLFFTSNHDENSWNGTEYEKYGDAAKVLAVLSFTWDALPLIYSGQELPSHKRLRFFEKDTIEWTDHLALHDFYKALLQLRLRHPAMQAGRDANPVWLSTSAGAPILAWMRSAGDRRVVTVLNFSKDTLQVHVQGVSGTFTSVLDGVEHTLGPEQSFTLQGWQPLVLAD